MGELEHPLSGNAPAYTFPYLATNQGFFIFSKNFHHADFSGNDWFCYDW